MSQKAIDITGYGPRPCGVIVFLYNQQLLLFGGDFAIGKLRVFVSFVAHDLNLQELEILAFRSAFDRKGNMSSSQVVFGHRVLALAQAVQRGLLLSDSQAPRQQQALQPIN